MSLMPHAFPMIDLRSDTVTQPTASMYERMRDAPLGDDGLDGDPTARELERHAAALLRKPAGLYVPSATMANLLALLCQSQRQGVVLAGASSHIYTSERGAATLTGAFLQPVPDPGGALDLQALDAALRDAPEAALVSMETTHNNAGGMVAPLEHLRRVRERAAAAGAAVHLDGARLFNAALALGQPAASLCECADTVAICLSKGLSAPMGAVLLGPEDLVHRARVLRRALGGTQRQVGWSAAAGLVALSPAQLDRLAEDHATARQLADGLASAAGLQVKKPQTNIVQVDVGLTGATAQQWEAWLRARGVLVREWGPRLLRCVTHRHLDAAAIAAAIDAFRAVAADCVREPSR